MVRLQVVAYDVAASSPAQPRVAALMRTLAADGLPVTLWTESDPGDWVHHLGGSDLIRVRVLGDPVRRTYRWLADRLPDRARPPQRADEGRAPGVMQRLWGLGSRMHTAVLFPDQQRLWVHRVQRHLLADLQPSDVVLTCARPESAALIGLEAQRRGARWWLDFADGWCFQGLRREAMVEGRRRERELALERSLVAAADLVSTVNGELRAYFGSLRPRGDVAIYPNIVPDELADLPLRRRGDRATPTLGYFGRLSLSDPERSLQPLLGLLRTEAERPDAPRARFRFLGEYSPQDLQEIDELTRLGHEVEVGAHVSRERLAAMRTDFDGALVLGSRAQRGTSSKLLDTLGLGLPVLAFVPVPSAAHELISETGCGEVMALAEPPDGERWRRFLRGVHGLDYCVDPRDWVRYTSRSVLPGFLTRITPWLHATREHR